MMKKLLDTAFAYAVAAMVGGVFYREFTKFNGFEGRTALGFVHTHLFLLGMFFFLILALFDRQLSLSTQKRFGLFYTLYNVGVALTAVMLTARGVTQVLGVALSPGLDASLSGMAGIGHILVGTGIVLFFVMARGCAGIKAGQTR